MHIFFGDSLPNMINIQSFAYFWCKFYVLNFYCRLWYTRLKVTTMPLLYIVIIPTALWKLILRAQNLFWNVLHVSILICFYCVSCFEFLGTFFLNLIITVMHNEVDELYKCYRKMMIYLKLKLIYVHDSLLRKNSIGLQAKICY